MPDVPLVMPKMSMTMTEGQVVTWHVEAGATVNSGDVLVEVMTDKVEMEVEAPASGVIKELVAEAGQTVPVGEPLAVITADSDGLLSGLLDSPHGPPSDTAAPDTAAPDTAAPDTARTGTEAAAADHPGLRAVPPSRKSAIPTLPGARRRAGELGVSLADLHGCGTGPDGAVSVRDVEAVARQNGRAQQPDTQQAAPDQQPAAQQGAPDQPAQRRPDQPDASPRSQQNGRATRSAPPAEQAPPADGSGALDPNFADALRDRKAQIRRAVAGVMTASAAVPQFTVWRTLDLQDADARRDGASWTAVLLGTLAVALSENGLAADGVGVALAVDTPVGLLAPVVRDAESRTWAQLSADVRDLAGRARSGSLRAADLDGATTTLSNLGGFGVERFNALLTPPQTTALATGRVARRPVEHGGGIALRLVCEVGLTVDHRAADGADAARVLESMARQLGAGDRVRAS